MKNQVQKNLTFQKSYSGFILIVEAIKSLLCLTFFKNTKLKTELNISLTQEILRNLNQDDFAGTISIFHGLTIGHW